MITIKSSIWTAVKHYAYGCFAKSWNAGIVAVYALIGQAVGAGMDPAHFNIPDWRTFAYTFAIVFGVQVIGYFKDHPLPEKLPDTVAPFPSTTEISAGKIITTPDNPVDKPTSP